jgi:uncharacterized membrane protein YbhN (UPF0104 family)
MSAARTPPQWARLLLKLGVTGAALSWAVSRTSFSAMTEAVRSLSLRAVLISVGLLLVNTGVGALRWRAVLGAYRGARVPGLGFLTHGYLVASFYNTFVPGNIGGDALRAHAARAAFEHPADSFATVAIERGLGLGALLVLGGVGVSFQSGAPAFMGLFLILGGAAAALLATASPWLSVRVLKWLPERFRSKVPVLSIPAGRAALGLAFLWSIVSQYLGVLSSHVLVQDLVPRVTALDSLAVVPLALLSLYVPISVAGLGVREAAFVVLFGRLGVSAADATAASLAFMATLMTAAVIGGIVHAFFPLALSPKTKPEQETAQAG